MKNFIFEIKMRLMKIRFDYYGWMVNRCCDLMEHYRKTHQDKKWKRVWTKGKFYLSKRQEIINYKAKAIEEKLGL